MNKTIRTENGEIFSDIRKDRLVKSYLTGIEMFSALEKATNIPASPCAREEFVSIGEIVGASEKRAEIISTSINNNITDSSVCLLKTKLIVNQIYETCKGLCVIGVPKTIRGGDGEKEFHVQIGDKEYRHCGTEFFIRNGNNSQDVYAVVNHNEYCMPYNQNKGRVLKLGENNAIIERKNEIVDFLAEDIYVVSERIKTTAFDKDLKEIYSTDQTLEQITKIGSAVLGLNRNGKLVIWDIENNKIGKIDADNYALCSKEGKTEIYSLCEETLTKRASDNLQKIEASAEVKGFHTNLMQVYRNYLVLSSSKTGGLLIKVFEKKSLCEISTVEVENMTDACGLILREK
jgi:hypothetical protein